MMNMARKVMVDIRAAYQTNSVVIRVISEMDGCWSGVFGQISLANQAHTLHL